MKGRRHAHTHTHTHTHKHTGTASSTASTTASSTASVDFMMEHGHGSGCAGCAVRLYGWESSDGCLFKALSCLMVRGALRCRPARGPAENVQSWCMRISTADKSCQMKRCVWMLWKDGGRNKGGRDETRHAVPSKMWMLSH